MPPATPFTNQLTVWLLVLETEATKVCEAPVSRITEAGIIDTTACAIFTEAVPMLVDSAADTALTVTEPEAGICAGAVNSPVFEIVPVLLVPPTAPLTSQVTAVLAVLLTVAVKAWVPVLGNKVTEDGATLTVTGGVIVNPMNPEAAASAFETAVTVTTGLLGTVVGGVKRPAFVIVPLLVLPPGTPLTSQVTAVLAVLVTVAVNACEPIPACTAGPVGLTVTVTGSTGVIGVRHGLVPALAGAVLVAVDDVTMTCAVSLAPRLSVTTTCTVTLPLLGACSIACAVAAPLRLALPLTTDQA